MIIRSMSSLGKKFAQGFIFADKASPSRRAKGSPNVTTAAIFMGEAALAAL